LNEEDGKTLEEKKQAKIEENIKKPGAAM